MISFKQKIGCWFNERWQTELVVRSPQIAQTLHLNWLDLKNRNERIEVDPLTNGRICRWQDTSNLTVARFYPKLGQSLLKHCLIRFPIEFNPQTTVNAPSLSFVLGVRGTQRMPQFHLCLKSLLAQSDIASEVVVVEQSSTQEFADVVPSGVRYVHTAVPADVPYNRSWALNVGVEHARGEYIVIVDADMLLPASFGKTVVETMQQRLDVLRPIRFLFYLDEATSGAAQDSESLEGVKEVSIVTQNTPNPIVIRRDAYLRIGGHDEAFYGWGGEDNEFINRASTLRYSSGGMLPAVHLWHASAKSTGEEKNRALLKERLRIGVNDRIRELVQRDFGQPVPSVDPRTTLTPQASP